MQAKQTLLDLGLVDDNEFLDKYVELFNSSSVNQEEVVQRHHFIPVYYYKNLKHLNRTDARKLADEDKNNELKEVSVRTHVLLHFYLEKCSTKKYRGKNIFSIYKLFGNKYSREELYRILDDEGLLEHYLNLLTNKYLFTDEHYKHLKDAIKTRKSQTGGDNISKNNYVGGTTGLKMMYDLSGMRRYIKKKDVEEKLSLGWTLPTNKKKTDVIYVNNQPHTYKRRKSQEEVHNNLSKSHLGHSPANKGVPCAEETKKKLAEAIRGRKWINNGKENKQVKESEIEMYIKLGYVIGQLKKSKDKGGDVNEKVD